ncbi:aggrecan core protein-like isoform X2 [Corythoichthys intestinalis]|uniref:aggrecan core protein-like isoform X2 n=1 Tax=Corythoichthys intestinalis TaxID=161448 RepID=UPI0025A4F07D|nr:aggrecan core protein-like isoform X2 [Corythoichthys intestinalis]
MKTPSFLLWAAIALGVWSFNGLLCEEDEHCPSGWHEFNGNCYYFSKDGEEKAWNLAKDDCSTKGGHLAIIRNVEEAEWLGSQINKTYNTRYNYWIGLTDNFVDGEWKWIDGTSLNERNWQPGQPNHLYGDRDCGATRGWNGRWKRALNFECFVIRPYICKRCQDGDAIVYNGIKGTCNLQLAVYPKVLEVLLEERLRPGRIIVIQGHVPQNATKFIIHLSLGHGKDTPVRIEVDFKDGDLELLTRVGSHVGGEYVNEFIKDDYFPFVAGSEFEMTIECRKDIFLLTVGDNYNVQYNNVGYELRDIHRLLVERDVTVTAVRLI